MRKSFIKRLASFIVAALAITSFPTQYNIYAAIQTVGSMENKHYIIGKELYSTDFETDTLGELPNGWEMSMPSWGWNGNG